MLTRLVVAVTLAAPPSPSPSLTPTPSPSASPTGTQGGSCPVPQQCEPPKVKGGGGFFGFDPVEKLANSLREGAIWTLERLATFWVKVDTPTISRDGVHAVGSVGWLQAQLHWFVGMAAVLGLLLAAGRMAWYRRGETLQQALSGMFTLVIVTSCSVAVITIATEAGDQFSQWIVSAAIGNETEFGDHLNALMWGQAAVTNAGLAIILFALCILAALAQIAMLYIRFAMLGLLAGFLPLAAGMTLVEQGKAWFKKMLGWLVAFVLYKPVAGCIYAYAFISVKAPDGTSQLVGIIVIILAVGALPATMRFVVPIVAATGGGGGAAMATVAAASAMAGRAGSGGGPSGAKQVSSSTAPPPAHKSDTPSGAQPAPGKQPSGQKPGEDAAPPAGAQPSSTSSKGGKTPSGAGGNPSAPATPPQVSQAPGAQVQGAQMAAAKGSGMAHPAAAAVHGFAQAKNTIKGAAEDATGEGGPSGSR